MVRTRNSVGVPLWVLLLAAVVLLAVLGRARPVLAPAPTMLPATSTAPAPAASSPSFGTGASNEASQRNINASVPQAPPAQGAPVASEHVVRQQAPASNTNCPAQPRSGLPCALP